MRIAAVVLTLALAVPVAARVHHVRSGDSADPRLITPAFAVDLAWDTTGVGNCWSKNRFGTSFPPDLPSCF